MAKIIDLSVPIYHGALTMPLDPKCAVIVHHTIDSMKYNITQLIISTHYGTHLDAPFHFFDKGRTVDELDLSKCVGPAVVLDFPGLPRRYSMGVKDFAKYEQKVQKKCASDIKDGVVEAISEKEYLSEGPMISPELARWLAKKKIAMLGLETPGVHPVEWEKVHKILLKAEIVIVEGLANLNKIKKENIFFIAAPLKIKGRDGSPVRAMAIEDMSSYQ